MKNKLEKEILDSMSKNPNNWIGIFYFNRKDPRLIVPKQYPWFGWTLNFANHFTWIFLAGVILILFASLYLF